MTPSIGRIVHYTLTESDAQQIMRRRTTGPAIAERIPSKEWPVGAQAHIGNSVSAGDVFPMIIIRVWPGDVGNVNGQVLLDGTDALWVTTVGQVAADSTDKQGLWFEAPRTP